MTKLIKQDSTNSKSPWTPEQVQLIASTVAMNATPEELKMFLVVAARSGLDPFMKQIYFIKSNGRVMMQASIDGFRVVAQRSKDFAGQGEPEFTEDENGNPIKCVVRAYRFNDGQRYEASVGVAYWKEYAKPGLYGKASMWDKMPHTMLAKVAEALALRKAFPNDLSGLYAQEEMDQATPSAKAETIREELSKGDTKTTMTPDEYMELPAADKEAIHEGVKANNRRLYAERKKSMQEMTDEIPVINE